MLEQPVFDLGPLRAVSTTVRHLLTFIPFALGMGLKGSSVPIFAAENSPARIRGALVMSCKS